MPSDRETTRRQFILGKSVRPEAERDTTDDPTASAAKDAYLVEIKRRAMACDFAIYLNAEDEQPHTEAAIATLETLDDLEAQLTVYRETSDLSMINQHAAQRAVRVEPRLFSLLRQAVELHAETDGAFDITAGPLSKVWGFYRRAGRVPTDDELEAALARVGSNQIRLDEERLTIEFSREGVELNLGGIGKGYALDRCRQRLLEAGVSSFLIHGGQSSVLAQGCHGDNDRGWIVGVKHPLRPDRRIAEITLTDQALGTSGSGTQSFRHQGRRYGHILDPRTAKPASGVLSATVIAPTATSADALATGCYVMGVEKSLEFCERHPELALLVVCQGDRSGSVQVTTVGLDDPERVRFFE